MAKPTPRRIRFLRALSILLLLFVTAAYLARTDGLYAVTIWPAFVWTGLGLIACIPGSRRYRTRAYGVLIVGWIAFFVAFAEEPARWANALVRPAASDWEIASLNCAGGSAEAAREALASKPRLVLFQESPGSREIEKLTKETYGDRGSYLHGPDASIVADGEVVPLDLPRGTSNFVAARVTLPGESPIFVVSLRLQPPVFRLDYWSVDCWQSYAANRASRRQELADVVRWIDRQAAGARVVVGGDFNTPPDPAVFAPFERWLVPATNDSGYTAVNEFPMARIDQIWVRGLHPVVSQAVRTANSDHRLVRCWVGATN